MKRPWQRHYGWTFLGTVARMMQTFWNGIWLYIIMYISVALKEIVCSVVVILFPGSYPKEKLKLNTKIYI